MLDAIGVASSVDELYSVVPAEAQRTGLIEDLANASR